MINNVAVDISDDSSLGVGWSVAAPIAGMVDVFPRGDECARVLSFISVKVAGASSTPVKLGIDGSDSGI